MKTTTLFLALVTGLLVATDWTIPVQGQPKPANQSVPQTVSDGGIRFVSPNIKAPATPYLRTRLPCSFFEQALLLPLVPSSNIGLTTQARPTFFLYLPRSSVVSAQFKLWDMDDKEIYQTILPISNQKGVVSFQLPANAPALEVNKTYRWLFHMICRPEDRLRDLVVDAFVRRIEPSQNLISALKDSNLRQHPKIYAEVGIWQDTLTALTQLRLTQPKEQTVIADWNSALDSVGLGKIQGVPPSEQQHLKPNSQ